MDSKDRIVTWLDGIYPFLTEAYLLTLTNKGIYNRAHKDLEKGKEGTRLVWNEEQLALQVQLEEEVCVTLKAPIQDSQCTCPSQSLCRHIMTALLYCKEYYEKNKQSDRRSIGDNGPSEGEASPSCIEEEKQVEGVADLLELEALTDEEIAKCFGKKIYNQALKQMEYFKNVSFDYGAFVTVTLEDKYSVYFTKTNTLSQAICSCKEAGLCVHKLYALIAYLQGEKKRQLQPIEEAFKWGEEEESCSLELKKEISLIVDKGLASLTKRSIRKVETLYIKAYGCKFYELASELKSLSGELIYYFSRNVAFSPNNTMHLLCKIYNRLEAMEVHKQDQVKLKYLLGQLRPESLELAELHLVGVGGRCFLSKRQDLVIMSYFYCQEVQRIITMSTLRPLGNSEGNNSYQRGSHFNNGLNGLIEHLYSEPLIWEEERSFKSIMSNKVVLEKGVLKEGKLSSTKKSQSKMVGETTLEDLLPLGIKNYRELKGKLQAEKEDYFKSYGTKQNTYIILPESISESLYNKVTQRLEFLVYDQRGESILFYLPYNAVTEKRISRLEETEKQIYRAILGQVFVKGDQLEAELLCLFKQEGVEGKWEI